MLSNSSSRVVLATVALLLVLPLTGCASNKVQRPVTEAEVTAELAALLPAGRIYPNDLGVIGETDIRGAFLFEYELVIEDSRGRITSLDRINLAPKWIYDGLPGPMDQAPGATPVSILMISDGMLFEVERQRGDDLHKYELNFIPSAGPAGTDSSAYIPSLGGVEGNRTLISVNLATGLQGWGMVTRGPITTQPQIGGSAGRPMLFYTTQRGAVFAQPATPSTSGPPDFSWTRRTHGTIASTPTLTEDLVLVGSEDGELWAFDRVTGGEHWVHYSGLPIRESAWASGDLVFFLNPAGFHALARDGGALRWTCDRQAGFIVRRPEAVYVDLGGSQVAALSPDTGEVLRTVAFPEGTIFPANMMDGIFYAILPNGFVYAVDVPLQ